jgi:acyl-CoA thioesterase
VTLSEILACAQVADGSASMAIGEDWLQGRSLFGGIQAVVGWRAMRTLVPVTMPLRTLQMTFIEPVPSGAVHATARVLRTGKNTLHVEARLEDSDKLQASMIAVFGTPRESRVRVEMPTPPGNAFDKPLRFAAGLAPNFMQQFDVSLVDGAPPFANAKATRAAYQIGLHDSGPLTEAHLLVFADFVPPVALSWMPKPTPGSSLTWMLELLREDFTAHPLAGWRSDAQLVAARDGYTSQSTTLYAPDGTAIVLSRQSMVVFD